MNIRRTILITAIAITTPLLLTSVSHANFSDSGVNIPGTNMFAWGDYDNDGDLDLAIAGTYSGSSRVTKIYRNDGNGTFSDTGISLPTRSPGSISWVDYDNDGDLDITIPGYYVYRNDGNNVFLPLQMPSWQALTQHGAIMIMTVIWMFLFLQM